MDPYATICGAAVGTWEALPGAARARAAAGRMQAAARHGRDACGATCGHLQRCREHVRDGSPVASRARAAAHHDQVAPGAECRDIAHCSAAVGTCAARGL
eukprot:7152190-Alexandrium_andersonii.AAC.1